jgi:hypothetical protein
MDTETYTLTVIATVPIAAGILFRFQFFDGLNVTYDDAVALSDVSQIDITIMEDIPVGTVVVVALTEDSSTLRSLANDVVYGIGETYYLDSIRAASANHTCLCWAYAPIPTTYPNTSWVPAAGQPQFNIGYAWQTPATPNPCPDVSGLTPSQATAPNVPDQWTDGQRWTWTYEVVYPVQFLENDPDTAGASLCVTVTAIKVVGGESVFVPGSWSALRDVIAQPWTAAQTNANTPSRWEVHLGAKIYLRGVTGVTTVLDEAKLTGGSGNSGYYDDMQLVVEFAEGPETREISDYDGPNLLATLTTDFSADPSQLPFRVQVPIVNATNSGPFVFAATPGQLAVVYFRPRQQVLDCDPPVVNSSLLPATTGPWTEPAELGLLVTSPLPPRTTLYFTVEPYNSQLSGFGSANPLVASDSVCAGNTSFVTHAPSFMWVTGSCVVPAGTVVFIDNIGSGTVDPIIVDAHYPGVVPNQVGSIVNNTLKAPGDAGTAVPSIIITSDWVNYGPGAPRPLAANRFVAAVLSDQYTGDAPPLAPMLTMPGTRAYGAVGYALGQTVDGCGLPGGAQAALANSTPWTVLTEATADALVSTDLPSFTGMQGWSW